MTAEGDSEVRDLRFGDKAAVDERAGVAADKLSDVACGEVECGGNEPAQAGEEVLAKVSDSAAVEEGEEKARSGAACGGESGKKTRGRVVAWRVERARRACGEQLY